MACRSSFECRMKVCNKFGQNLVLHFHSFRTKYLCFCRLLVEKTINAKSNNLCDDNTNSCQHREFSEMKRINRNAHHVPYAVSVQPSSHLSYRRLIMPHNLQSTFDIKYNWWQRILCLQSDFCVNIKIDLLQCTSHGPTKENRAWVWAVGKYICVCEVLQGRTLQWMIIITYVIKRTHRFRCERIQIKFNH